MSRANLLAVSRLWFSLRLVLPLSAISCVAQVDDQAALDDTDDDLTQGVTQAGLWQSKTVSYCFEHPNLASMPASVRARVSSQADLDQRWERRKQEFVGAIQSTWQSVGVLDLVAQGSCQSGMVVVRYNTDTPTGGYAGIGRDGGLSIGVQMDSEFLGETYPWGGNTYHTFVAAHEFGHVLGFRHEQDRTDSSCKTSQDFSGTGILLTGYDANSVMNYCARQVTGLTDLDREGFRKAYAFLGTGGGTCSDKNGSCSAWAEQGECSANPDYMIPNCCTSCNREAPRVILRASNKCLDIDAAGTANGSTLQIYSCNGTGAQAFVLKDVGGGAYTLVNPNSNKCVDIQSSGSADGTKVQLYTCNGTGAQKFTLRPASGDFVSLVNVSSQKCLDVAGAATGDKTKVHLWTCHGGTNQQWKITP